MTFNPPFAVVDIETTGGQPHKGDRVMEVAVVRTNGFEIDVCYETLINPIKKVPPFVANMTGLSNELLRKHPLFHQIAEELLEYLEGATFVAHNASFDLGFLQFEYHKLGIAFEPKHLCTIQLAKKYLPEKINSYGLDSLTKYFGIKIKDRHRAMGDAYATAKLLHKLWEIKIETEGWQPTLF